MERGELLQLRHVSHRYGQRRALDSIDLSVSAGVIALLGVNGAGKTTLLSIAGGALKPSAGGVTYKSDNLYESKQRRVALPRIAIMPQRLGFPPRFKVWEFVAYIGYLRGLRWRAAEKSSKLVLEEVGLATRQSDKMGSLSGGMLRRVALAQALVTSPDVLLLDEPTTGLDPQQRASIRRLLGELAPRTLVILSSHLVEDVEMLADQVIVLHDGTIRFSGSAEELRSKVGPDGAANATESAFLRLISKREGNAA
jgi:ABC-2 type transport system ATP-binding protein